MLVIKKNNVVTNRNRGNILATRLVINIFLELRPKQWTKNIIVFAALLFLLKAALAIMLLKSIIGFFLF